MSSRAIPGLALLVVLLGATRVRADEIRLKDGTKIIGTIVGFENDSFRVQTSYGYALIEKDKVADINITQDKKPPEAKAKSSMQPAPPAPPAAAVVPAVAKEPATLKAAPPEAIAPSKQKTVTAAAPAPPPVPPPTPPPPPDPPVVRDEIRGNLYVNLTYGFQMFRPPSWDLIPDARKALPDAIGALGTNDQTTLLVIGRQHTKDSLIAHAAATGKALAEAYENYRLISSDKLNIAGYQAIEERARGTADGHDWSVLLVTFLKGEDAYTLMGMTWADSDLIQVEENVISKTVNSLTFTTQ